MVQKASTILNLWVVYQNPLDFPGLFVARRFEIGPGTNGPTNEYKLATTLDEIRALIPPGLFRLGRDVADDPVIVEVWL